MSSIFLPWMLVAALLVVSGGLFWRLRSLSEAREALDRERERLAEQLAAAEKRFEERGKSQRKRGEEVAELRKKLEKARKRAAQARDEHRGESSQIRELQAALERAEGERQHALRELERLRDASQNRPVVAKPAPPPPPAVSPPAPETNALQERAEKAEARAAQLGGDVTKLREEVSRHKRKARALDDAYRAQHGELQAKKDRLRTQQEELERLRALKVTLVDSLPES